MPRRTQPRSTQAPDVTSLAAVLADASRIAMLDVLLDGQAHAVGVLARRSGVTAATASSHLRRLVDARLVVVAAVGRERHVRLAGPEVADASLIPQGPAVVLDSTRASATRTCTAPPRAERPKRSRSSEAHRRDPRVRPPAGRRDRSCSAR